MSCLELFMVRSRVAFVSLLSFGVAAAGYCTSFVQGDIYTSNYFSRDIRHYSQAGVFVDQISVDSSYGTLYGMTFGPDGLLYAVSEGTSGDYNVLALDALGSVVHEYSGADYVAGNLSFGKIGFGTDGSFYVAAQDNLRSFAPGSTNGTLIYSANQIFDVEGLPNGNLLVGSAYSLQEITSTGTVVKTYNPSVDLVDLRGIEYDASTDSIYVSMLGFSGQFFRVMRLDGDTGVVEANETYNYADDLCLTADGKLLVGSRTMSPAIYDKDLNFQGTVGSDQQLFITQMPVPEPSSLVAGIMGIAALAVRSRRRPL